MLLPVQPLRLLEETFVVRREDVVPTDDEWLVVVRAPDGVTVVRRLRGVGEAPDGSWRAFHGEAAHELDAPGMLLAVIAPLSTAGLPVFAASTFDADLVLVPTDRVERAVELLVAAGHEVRR